MIDTEAILWLVPAAQLWTKSRPPNLDARGNIKTIAQKRLYGANSTKWVPIGFAARSSEDFTEWYAVGQLRNASPNAMALLPVLQPVLEAEADLPVHGQATQSIRYVEMMMKQQGGK